MSWRIPNLIKSPVKPFRNNSDSRVKTKCASLAQASGRRQITVIPVQGKTISNSLSVRHLSTSGLISNSSSEHQGSQKDEWELWLLTTVDNQVACSWVSTSAKENSWLTGFIFSASASWGVGVQTTASTPSLQSLAASSKKILKALHG